MNASGAGNRTTRRLLGSMYVLTCGCEVERQPFGYRYEWVVTHRCDEHPTDPIPVEGMARLV